MHPIIKSEGCKSLLVLMVMIAGIVACGSDFCLAKKANEVRAQLNAQIKLGDSKAVAQATLAKLTGHSVTYDQFQNRLWASDNYASCSPDAHLSIYVQLGNDGKVSEIKVLETYTAL